MTAYIVSRINVTNPDRYPEYTKHTPGLVAKHGGKFVVRGGASETLEGPEETRRIVVIEFPDMKKAKSFYNDPEYQEVMKIRQAASQGEVLLVEGA